VELRRKAIFTSRLVRSFRLDLWEDFELSQEQFSPRGTMKALSIPTGLLKTLYTWSILMRGQRFCFLRLPANPGQSSYADGYATGVALRRHCLSKRGGL
jgi:hypothetical protein